MKPRPCLEDMPLHIKEKIVAHMGLYSDRMTLRVVNKGFRRVIGEIPIEAESVKLEYFGMGYIDFCFLPKGNYHERDFTVRYQQQGSDCSVGSKNSFMRAVAPNEDYLNLSTKLFARLVDNSNLHVENFSFTVKDPIDKEVYPDWDKERIRFMRKVQHILSSLRTRLKVKNVKIYYTGRQKEVHQILPYLDPETLKFLQICVPRMPRDIMKVGRILELEQWNNLEKLSMFDLPDNQFPMEKWWDYPRTSMTLNYTELDDLKKLIPHFRESPRFEFSYIHTDFSEQQLKQALGRDLEWERRSGLLSFHFEETNTERALHMVVKQGELQFSRKPIL